MSTFSALAHRDFRLLWGGLLISNSANWLQQFALAWFAVELAVREGTPERTSLYVGLIGASRGIPGLASGVLAGAIADRYDRRRLLMITQTFAGLVAASLAVLVFTGRANLVLLMLGIALASAGSSFDQTARMALYPSLVPRAAFSSAVGVNLMGLNVATLVGPLLGGLLVGPFGVEGVLAAAAAGYLPILAALRMMRAAPAAAPPVAHPSILESVREGFGYVWRDDVLRPLFVLFGIATLVAWPYQQLLAAFVHDALGGDAHQLSLVIAAGGAGALCGSAIAASLGHVRRRGVLLAGSATVFGALVVLFAAQRSVGAAAGLAAITGAACWTYTGVHVGMYQGRTPDRLQGRVVGVAILFLTTLMPLGSLLFGSLGSLIGIHLAIGIGGATLVLTGILILARSPGLRAVGTLEERAAAAHA